MAWGRCFNNRNIAHSSKYKVFEAVSESIMLYAAQVWGCRKYDTVEKLLRYYVKRSFHLPPNTPNYMIMVETGLSPLFIKTFKLQVDYILKVLDMSEHRLPKKAALQAIHSGTGWFNEWMELAHGCGVELTFNGSRSWKSELYQLISKVDEQERFRFLEEASGSLHRTIYSRLNHNLQLNYFRDEYSVDEISMVLKLRGELLKLNFMPHRNDLPLYCSLCNLQEREDIFHFLGKCPILRETRRHFLNSDFLTEEQALSLFDEINVFKLFQYCKRALAYRERIMNENF